MSEFSGQDSSSMGSSAAPTTSSTSLLLELLPLLELALEGRDVPSV